MKIILNATNAQTKILSYMGKFRAGTPISIKDMRNEISTKSYQIFDNAMEQLTREGIIALQAYTAPNPPDWTLRIGSNYYAVAILR